ncbi:MAG TPA: thioredoxin domain-containing protein, partial [Caulobacteraceae bacterium]|nr:thioredoxin domain-containing protein [Caulobacteraceae bacterium]
MRSASVFAVALAALSVAACKPAADTGFDAKVKAYLMSHPEELHAALQNMQDKEDATQASDEARDYAKAQTQLASLRGALERDPRDFVANPNGKVTVTEFYDYRCPHCINIAPKVVALIHSHPDVRFVFKEMPIFGATSEHAARAAMAAKAQGKDYVGLYEAFMSARPLTDDEIDRIAASKGVDIAAMNAPAAVAKDNAQIAATADLAKKLAIDGTPGFVVGDEFVR